jgi:hypothetical protein
MSRVPSLVAAIRHGIMHGGWIPKCRLTEKGPLPDKHKSKEMPTETYPKQTKRNVIDSDGTLIFSHGELTGGSALTKELAKKRGKPCLHLERSKVKVSQAAKDIREWISSRG